MVRLGRIDIRSERGSRSSNVLGIFSHSRTHFGVAKTSLVLVVGRTVCRPKGRGIFSWGGGLSTTANPARSICGQEARQAANNEVEWKNAPKLNRKEAADPMAMARRVAQPSRENLNFRQSTSIRGERKVMAKGRTAVGHCERRQSLVVRAVDTEVLLGVGAAVVGTAVGMGTLIFYDNATRAAEKRENRQPCFACSGTGTIECRFCNGTGAITVDLGGDQTESSTCINCDGKGSITCTTCNGTGIQPRYLDRREFQDDD